MNKEALLELGSKNVTKEIELDIEGEVFKFDWAEPAPPVGMMATNYSRFCLMFLSLSELLSNHT